MKQSIDQTTYYAGIIGESPSRGAKSPLLWNKVFETLNIPCRMRPMDVQAEQLASVITGLREDERFIGGAVAVPYKEVIPRLLDDLEPEAKAIGAVNCVYRKDGKLIGANTDGAGALVSLQNQIGKDAFNGACVLVIGIGGAGRAVAAYVASALGRKGRLILSNRHPEKAENLSQTLSKSCDVILTSWPVDDDILRDVNIIINCSSIGFGPLRKDSKGSYTLQPYTPLAVLDENLRVSDSRNLRAAYMRKALPAIKRNLQDSLNKLAIIKEAVIFDIVYQPVETTLLHLASQFGFKTINGVGMNLEQAVIAFQKTTSSGKLTSTTDSQIRSIMKEVW